MATTLSQSNGARHRLLPETAQSMAKADIRKADVDGWKVAIGCAIERTRTLAQCSLKEFASAIARDERQVARWIAGTERPQFDAIFGAPHLRGPLVVALAEISGGADVITTIQIRRSA